MRYLLSLGFGVYLVSYATSAQAPRAPEIGVPAAIAPGTPRTVLVDNSSVRLARIIMAPWPLEQPETHPFEVVSVNITPCDGVLTIAGETHTGRRAPGSVGVLPRDTAHSGGNVGTSACEVVVLVVNPAP